MWLHRTSWKPQFVLCSQAFFRIRVTSTTSSAVLHHATNFFLKFSRKSRVLEICLPLIAPLFLLLVTLFHRCFIPNGYAALASVVGPALLSLVAVLVIFMQAFQVKPQWKRYDDIYMGRYNTTGSVNSLISTDYNVTHLECFPSNLTHKTLRSLFPTWNFILNCKVLLLFPVKQMPFPFKSGWYWSNSTFLMVWIEN